MRVIDLKIVAETGRKVLSGTEVTPFQKPPGQDAKPQLHLVEPGAMYGGKVEHMLMARIAQESPPLCPSMEVGGHKGHLAPLGDQTADVQAPVGVEVIQHPGVAVHLWQLLDDMAEMSRKIGTGAGLTQAPHDVTRWHHKRGDQGACPMPDVFMLTFFRFPRRNGMRWMFALKNLHAGLFIGTEDQPPLLQEALGTQV